MKMIDCLPDLVHNNPSSNFHVVLYLQYNWYFSHLFEKDHFSMNTFAFDSVHHMFHMVLDIETMTTILTIDLDLKKQQIISPIDLPALLAYQSNNKDPQYWDHCIHIYSIHETNCHVPNRLVNNFHIELNHSIFCDTSPRVGWNQERVMNTFVDNVFVVHHHMFDHMHSKNSMLITNKISTVNTIDDILLKLNRYFSKGLTINRLTSKDSSWNDILFWLRCYLNIYILTTTVNNVINHTLTGQMVYTNIECDRASTWKSNGQTNRDWWAMVSCFYWVLEEKLFQWIELVFFLSTLMIEESNNALEATNRTLFDQRRYSRINRRISKRFTTQEKKFNWLSMSVIYRNEKSIFISNEIYQNSCIWIENPNLCNSFNVDDGNESLAVLDLRHDWVSNGRGIILSIRSMDSIVA